MPEPSLPAARRSACSRRGASRYAWPAVCGVVMGAAWSRAPAGVATVAGEPAAEPTTPKLASTDDCSTPDTAWRSELSCWGLARWAWGAVVLLQAAASTATTARPHRGGPGRPGMRASEMWPVPPTFRAEAPRRTVQAGNLPPGPETDRGGAAPPLPP